MTLRLSTFGGLKEGDVYIERTADADLLAALLRGDYTSVLSSRQTGKTSLMLRTQRKLHALGTRTIRLDLGAIGTTHPDRWLRAIAVEISDELALDSRWVEDTFARHQQATPLLQFLRFLRQVIALDPSPLVLFIDELEGFQRLPVALTDDFLAGLRSLHNARSAEPLYRRFAVCLLGVCTPNDLIRDERRTPFNVARGIVLDDFTQDETLRGFLPALSFPDAETVLGRIHHHTSGHPFLTHRLVWEADQQAQSGHALTTDWVDRTVQDLFLAGLGRGHENLLEVERRLCLGPPHRARQRVALYQSVRRGLSVPVRSRDPLQLELRLTGLVRQAPVPHGEPILVVRNRIFAALFDEHWTPKSDPGKLDPTLWLRDRVQHWIDLDRHEAAVLRSAELHEAQRWATTQPALDHTTERYLAASERVDQRERTSRLYALLWTLLWSSFTNFLLAPLLIEYWRQHAYPGAPFIKHLHNLPFVLALPCGLIADRLRIAPANLLVAGLALITTGLLTLTADTLLPQHGLAFLALGLFVLGQTLQYPQAAVLIGLLFPRTDRRLDLSFVAYYCVVSLGSLLGPLVGALAFEPFGMHGYVGVGLASSSLALYALLASRSGLLPLTLPLRVEQATLHEAPTNPVRPFLLLMTSILIFWCAFDLFGNWLAQAVSSAASPSVNHLAARFIQKLSQEGITSLWMLGLAPLVAACLVVARRAFAEPSAHVKLVVGLGTLVIALLMGFTTASPQSLLRYAALFSVAELLVVPATLSLSTALAPAGRLSTWLACCFLVTGLGGWLGAWLQPSAAHFVALAAIAVTLTVAICGRSWPSFQPKHTASPPY